MTMDATMVSGIDGIRVGQSVRLRQEGNYLEVCDPTSTKEPFAFFYEQITNAEHMNTGKVLIDYSQFDGSVGRLVFSVEDGKEAKANRFVLKLLSECRKERKNANCERDAKSRATLWRSPKSVPEAIARVFFGMVSLALIFIAASLIFYTPKPEAEQIVPATTEFVSQDGATEVEVETDTETVGQKNAVESAQSYLSYSSFSRFGLIKQLEFEGYSPGDAVYAVDKIGANWNEQAAKSAQAYLDYSSFSRSGLIDQLKYEGFTQEQAEYGVNAVGY